MSRFRITARKRASERVQAIVGGNGWPGRLFGAPLDVTTTEHDIQPAYWPQDAPPLRIAFASDFHAGPTTHPNLWAAACDALNRAEPDIVLLGGDFVVLEARHVDALAERLGRVTAPLGSYAVLGNHDYYAGAAYIASRLEGAGIRMLTNQAVCLPDPHRHISICGLDDWGYGKPDAATALGGADGVRVVLMHKPVQPAGPRAGAVRSCALRARARWADRAAGRTRSRGASRTPFPKVLPRALSGKWWRDADRKPGDRR